MFEIRFYSVIADPGLLVTHFLCLTWVVSRVGFDKKSKRPQSPKWSCVVTCFGGSSAVTLFYNWLRSHTSFVWSGFLLAEIFIFFFGGNSIFFRRNAVTHFSNFFQWHSFPVCWGRASPLSRATFIWVASGCNCCRRYILQVTDSKSHVLI